MKNDLYPYDGFLKDIMVRFGLARHLLVFLAPLWGSQPDRVQFFPVFHQIWICPATLGVLDRQRPPSPEHPMVTGEGGADGADQQENDVEILRFLDQVSQEGQQRIVEFTDVQDQTEVDVHRRGLFEVVLIQVLEFLLMFQDL